MAIQSQPSRIPQPFAGSGTKNVIPSTNSTPTASQAASWASGFPPECSQPISAGGCPVPRNDMNGALNQISQDFAFRQDGGIWAWSAQADYDTQRIVRGADGRLYWSVQQSGPGIASGAVDPTADDGTHWTAIPTNSADVVHISGAEKILGQKVFTNTLILETTSGGIVVQDPAGPAFGGNTSLGGALSFSGNDSYEDFYARLVCSYSVSESYMAAALYRMSDYALYRLLFDVDAMGAMLAPHSSVSGQINLGGSGNRWGDIYATSATINTSDARLKTEPQKLPDEALDAWEDVSFVQFQMLDAVAKKGADQARLHTGLIAQQIDEAFKAHGLDARRYGLFCWDAWESQPEERDGCGRVIAEARSAGDEFSLRYEEALCMEAAYQRRRADRAEIRLAALEERLAALEAKLG